MERFLIKWLLCGAAFAGGAALWAMAYARRGAGGEFRLRHLFEHRSVGRSSSTQLLIEGLIGILLGIVGLVWL
jgi:hypothetical protein